MSEQTYKLDPLYVNGRRITTLVGSHVAATHLEGPTGFNEKLRQHQISVSYAELLQRWLDESGEEVAPLEQDWLKGRLKSGRIFTVHRHFTFRNARGDGRDRPLAYSNFPELGNDGKDLRLELLLEPSHVVVGSPGDLLTGKVADLVVCALLLDVSPDQLTAVPIFIGHKVMQGPMDMLLSARSVELFPELIDNFAEVQRVRRPRKDELNALMYIPEEEIKNAFSEIIGEPYIQKDWGGERSDLLSTHVRVDGSRVSAAFLFKGPAGGSKFRAMTIKDLGKNGDQIERLATEPADLLVVQHCHQVTSAVRSMLRAFCNQIGHLRRCCILDGYETLRILRAYKKCNL